MTDLLDLAVATARNLTPTLQDEVARLVLAYLGEDQALEDQPLYEFSPEEAAEIDEAEAAAARGDFLSDAEVAALWAKHGL